MFYLSRLIVVTCLAIFLSSCYSGEDHVAAPNIIVIFADDLGYGELGCYGQEKIETPHIDRLATGGMRFTNFYTGAPVCAPSRCILLTGKHSGHANVRGNDEAGYRGDVWSYLAMAQDPGLEGQEAMDSAELTIAEVLQADGYRTGLIGKWGLGYPGSVSTPNKQGFDYFYGYNCQRQAHTLTPLHLWENEHRVHLNNDTVITHRRLAQGIDTLSLASYAPYEDQPDYAPSLMVDKVLSFVSDNNDADPFFLYWATPIPHLPLQAPQQWVQHYVDKWGERASLYRQAGLLSQ